MGATTIKGRPAGGGVISDVTARILGIGQVPFWEMEQRRRIEARQAEASARRAEDLEAIARATGGVSVPMWSHATKPVNSNE